MKIFKEPTRAEHWKNQLRTSFERVLLANLNSRSKVTGQVFHALTESYNGITDWNHYDVAMDNLQTRPRGQ